MTCSRPAYSPLTDDSKTSSLSPGPVGFGSPCISLTISARYVPLRELTMNFTVSPTFTLGLSVYPTTSM